MDWKVNREFIWVWLMFLNVVVMSLYASHRISHLEAEVDTLKAEAHVQVVASN